MKKERITLVASLILAVCLIGCTANNRKVRKIEMEGRQYQEFEEIETEEGSFLKDGYFKEWHYNGQIYLIGEYCMNKMCGYWKAFYENGSVYEEGNYVNDMKDGLWKTYYDNGSMYEEGSYANGMKDGLWKEYKKDGQAMEMTYKNGNYAKILGTWIEDDKTIWVFNEDGTYTETDANGKVFKGKFSYNRETSPYKLYTGYKKWVIKFENDSLFSARFTDNYYNSYRINNARKQP